jgi:hypothetical protein
MKKRFILFALAAAIVGVGAAQAAPIGTTWLSVNATIRDDGTIAGNPDAVGLVRGDILGSDGFTNAELKFYTSTDDFGVAEPAIGADPVNFRTSGGAQTDGELDGAGDGPAVGWWDEFVQGNPNTFPYVGKSSTDRTLSESDDGTVNGLPGLRTDVRDITFHAPLNTDQLVTIAFVAPEDGLYLVENFAARAVSSAPSQNGRQSVALIDDRDGTDVVDLIVAGGDGMGGSSGSTRYTKWIISDEAHLFDLQAGEEIHFGVHHGSFEVDSDNWGLDNTEVAFDITVVPEPATMLLIVGGLAGALRRRFRG